MSTDKSQCRSWLDAHGAKHSEKGATNEELIQEYDRLADKYDEFYFSPDFKCAGYGKSKQTMSDLYPDNRADVTVLDIGAGTGNIGALLKETGFTTLDAFEPSAKMLEIAGKKGIYRNLYNAFLTDKPVELPTDSYDAIVMQAVIGPDTVPVVAFKELARIVKPGGHIVVCNRASYLEEIPDFKENWGPFVARLEQEGTWKLLKRERYPNQFMDHEGLLLVFRIC